MTLFKLNNIVLSLLLVGSIRLAPILQRGLTEITAKQIKTEDLFILSFNTKIASIFTLGNPRILRHFSMIYGLQYLQDNDFNQNKPEEVERTLTFLMQTGIDVVGFYVLACEKVIAAENNMGLCEDFIKIGMGFNRRSWLLPLYLAEKYNSILHDAAKALPYFIIASEKPDPPEFMGSYINKIAKKIDLSPEELDFLKERIKEKIFEENELRNTK